jgi:hypothetical protein
MKYKVHISRNKISDIPTQPITGIKLQMSIKVNIYLLYWYFQQDQCLNIKNMPHGKFEIISFVVNFRQTLTANLLGVYQADLAESMESFISSSIG